MYAFGQLRKRAHGKKHQENTNLHPVGTDLCSRARLNRWRETRERHITLMMRKHNPILMNRHKEVLNNLNQQDFSFVHYFSVVLDWTKPLIEERDPWRIYCFFKKKLTTIICSEDDWLRCNIVSPRACTLQIRAWILTHVIHLVLDQWIN